MPPEADGDGDDEPADDDADGFGEEGMESEPEEVDPVVNPEVEPAQDICFEWVSRSCQFNL